MRLRREAPPKPTGAEREVADLLPIEADPDAATAVLDRVPLWFHTFSLDHSEELYTPGVARDHRYRIPALPEDFSGTSVLDVGTFDGFYAFLAEARGARRVVAVDNEQYRAWVKSRWGVALEGGEGFTAIRELLGSRSSTAVSTPSISTNSRRRSTSSSASGSCTGSRTRSACSGCFDGASRPKAGCFSRPTAQPIGRSRPRRLSTSMRQARSTLAMTSCIGALPPQVWTRWPAMRASRPSS